MEEDARDMAVRKLVSVGLTELDATNVCSMLETVGEILQDTGLVAMLAAKREIDEAEVASAVEQAKYVRKFGLMQ